MSEDVEDVNERFSAVPPLNKSVQCDSEKTQTSLSSLERICIPDKERDKLYGMLEPREEWPGIREFWSVIPTRLPADAFQKTVSLFLRAHGEMRKELN